MKMWLDCNPKQFTYIDGDGDKIINSKNCAYVILSCLHGSKRSHFMKVELQKLADEDTWLHNWEMLVKEVEGLFCPQLQIDWAKKQDLSFQPGES